MNQCVPSRDLGDTLLIQPPLSFPDKRRYPYDAKQLLMSDTKVTELTWENGNPAIAKPVPKYPDTATAWEKTGPSGTLESIINQATRSTHHQLIPVSSPPPGLPTLHHSPPTAADTLVPGSDRDDIPYPRKRSRVAEEIKRNCASQGSCAPVGRGESTVLTLDTWELTGTDDVGFTTNSASPEEFGFATTSASPEGGGSPETDNTSFGGGRQLTLDDHDSFCHSRGQSQRDRRGEDQVSKGETGRSAICVSRRRTSAIHNQSERKRRDRINERMKALQKLVPNSSKTDKASMLDEVIEYLKQLQAQIQVISSMNSMPPMMMPMPMAMAQYQMSMLANMAQMSQMGMGMGMGMGRMDLSPLGQPTNPSMPSILQPPAFLPHLNGSSWDAANDRIQPPTVPVPVPVPVPAAAASGPILPDPFSAAFVAGPAQMQQPMGMDMFNRMAALYQQLHQQPPPTIPKT